MGWKLCSRFAACVSLLGPLASIPGFASEGVGEINQTCAVLTGCFPGDTLGFPVTIDGSAGASYRLTGDLLVPHENARAINVLAPDVSIDLGGFEIRGVTTCSGSPLSCSPTGFGVGIDSSSSGVQIRNGSIIGMGSTGLLIRAGGVAENVRSTQNGLVGIRGTEAVIVRNNIASSNGGTGIFVGKGASISDNSTSGNGFAGILTGAGSTISGNSTHSNGTVGIIADEGCVVFRNTSTVNGRNGIQIREGSLVRENTIYQNDSLGISAINGVTILGNSVVNNGDLTDPNLDDGIFCGAGCFIRGNTIRDNLSLGIFLATDSAYRENVVTNNANGGVGGLGVSNSRGDNYCAGPGVGGAFCP